MSDLRATIRETLVANLFDGDDAGTLTAPLSKHVDDITDVVMESVLDAFLASPQAAEELARALESESARRFIAEAWVESGVSEPGYATTDEMVAAILAAWQKVRTPEEA